MLLKVDVVSAALRSIPNLDGATILYTCPKGNPLHHSQIDAWATTSNHLVIICGYYEGMDERVFDLFPITRVSLGDFVLSSGEIPALAIMDSVVRRLPGVLGNPDCIDDESIISHVLEAPQYTRPQEFEGKTVPEILQSGNHQGVALWERTQALNQTLFKKPHLLSDAVLSDQDQAIIVNLLKNQAGGHT
jgi:tRNA (guanine-N1)-methyltransferase